MRICSRGHENPRGVTFCAQCGSAELSTPGPPASLLHVLSGLALYGLGATAVGIVLLSLVLGVLYSIDWQALSGPLIALVLMLGFLYWTTTLLPGPIKRIGKAAGKRLMQSGKRKD